MYAKQAIDTLSPKPLSNIAGEDNQLLYQGRGVTAVISPWNFPLSICCGMTVASLVTGNTTIVKPAEQTPGIARLMCEILWQAGVPKDVLHFLPGIGETIGAALVKHPLTANIAFTGSKAVGLSIVQDAAVTAANQHWVKRVVCEMGGKNAIIIDASADLDEAVLGVRQSAFGYAGQKCSAASRVIVLREVFQEFLHRLIESTKALRCGDPTQPGIDLGPVIDDQAADKIRHYIELGRQETGETGTRDRYRRRARSFFPLHRYSGRGLGRGFANGRNPLPTLPRSTGGGSRSNTTIALCAPPGKTAHRPPHFFHRALRRAQNPPKIALEEIFGPVLTVIAADNLDQAFTIANSVDYKLTGGCFTRTPSTLDRARQQFNVGNLYLNRGITGALVGRQPFGGFALSGIGRQSRRAGPDYLKERIHRRPRHHRKHPPPRFRPRMTRTENKKSSRRGAEYAEKFEKMRGGCWRLAWRLSAHNAPAAR